MIKDFFLNLDKEWKPVGTEPILLPIIGSVASFLQCDYERGTKDADLQEVEKIPKSLYAPMFLHIECLP